MGICILDVTISSAEASTAQDWVIPMKQSKAGPSSVVGEVGVNSTNVELLASSDASVVKAKPMRALASMFDVLDSESVNQFVAANNLRDLLNDAHDYLRYYFGKNSLTLCLVSDPNEPGFQHLNLSVNSTEEELDEAFSCLDRFRGHWWSKSLPKAKGQLTISLAC